MFTQSFRNSTICRHSFAVSLITHIQLALYLLIYVQILCWLGLVDVYVDVNNWEEIVDSEKELSILVVHL